MPSVHTGGCLRPTHKVPGPGEDGLGLRPAKPVLCTVYTLTVHVYSPVQTLLGAIHGYAGDVQLTLVLCRLRQT